VFLEHWDHNERTDAGNFCAGDGQRVALNSVRMFGGEIGDMHDLFCFGDPHDRSVLAWLMTAAPHELDISLWHTEQCNQASGGSLNRNIIPKLASQTRVAFSSMASNTGCSSPDELETTLSTSDVAVCCSKDSESSRVRACTSSNSRTFSMAITA